MPYPRLATGHPPPDPPKRCSVITEMVDTSGSAMLMEPLVALEPVGVGEDLARSHDLVCSGLDWKGQHERQMAHVWPEIRLLVGSTSLVQLVTR